MTDFNLAPDFVGPTGVKWWKHKGLTDWATRDIGPGTPLKDAIAYSVQEVDGNRTILLVMAGEIVYENQGLEAVAARIDMERLAFRGN
jgi:hypothetical protein